MQTIAIFDRYEIRLSGAGGQGIILAAIILAEAIGIYEEKFVTMSQSYGPEARGGACASEIVVSTSDIDYPKVEGTDLLLAMNQESCDKYYKDIKSGGVLLVDSTFVTHIPHVRAFPLPFTQTAREQFGKEIVATIMALGSLCKITGIVTLNALEQGLLNRVPKGTEETNLVALKKGYTLAEEFIANNPNDLKYEERNDEDPFDQ